MMKFGGFLITLLMLPALAWAEFKDFSVIVNNQTGTLLTSVEQVQGTAVSFGVAVDGEGNVSRVAVDDASSVATISGTYHSDHGCTGLSIVVPVTGNVKISVGHCLREQSHRRRTLQLCVPRFAGHLLQQWQDLCEEV